jgi:capsular exopolysaccharide synthesis family protein
LAEAPTASVSVSDPSPIDRYPVEQVRGRSAAGTVGPTVAPAATRRPSLRTQSRPAAQTPLDSRLVGSQEIRAVCVEQYRHLAAVLLEAQADRSIRSIMVTSAVPSEGKTLTATNLALTLSQSYARRVLLIDADLRCPAVHEMFGVSNDTGLSDGLRSDRTPLAFIEVSSHLTLLTGGRPDADPLAGLSSARMKALVDEAVTRFDWVIVDSPPLGLLSDAQLVGRLVDAVLLVVAAGKTPCAVVQRAVAELSHDRIIGAVLNRADEEFVMSLAQYKHYDTLSERP